MAKKDVSNSGPDDQSRDENMDSNMEPNQGSILSYVDESKDQILKEEPNRNHAAMLAYVEENIDSTMKEEPNQKTKSAGKEKEKVSKTKVKKFRKRKVWKKIEYIGFASISVFCAFFVMVIWLLSRNDSNKAKETEEVKNETASTSNMCPFWELAGDGYCDDETNIPECGYDYDDCCQLENDRSLCTNCTCHLTEDEAQLFRNQSCIDNSQLDQHLIHFDAFFPELSPKVGGPGSHHLGNRVCDLNFNQDKYFFDIGDCCLDKEIKCRFGANYIECPHDTCIQSNNFCIAEELGDGLCQDHNNGPYCDFDLGDCCTSKNNHLNESDSKDCCACFCRNAQLYFFG